MATLMQMDETKILVVDTGVVYECWDEESLDMIETKLVKHDAYSPDSVGILLARDQLAEQMWEDMQHLCVNKDRWVDPLADLDLTDDLPF